MDKLNILWTTDNKKVVLNMLAMYSINSKTNKWFKDVNIIVWGPSAKLISNDPHIKTEVVDMISIGITIEACKDCCDNYEVTDKLLRLGINVKYMGEPLTEYL